MDISPNTSRNERGSAALELAMAAPLLVLMMAFCLDIGTYLQAMTTTSSAATAATRYLMNHPKDSDDPGAIRAYLDECFPELGFGAGEAQVEILVDSKETQSYSYRLYDGDTLVEFPATDEHEHFRVTVATTTTWPATLPFLSDGDGTFTTEVTREGDADRTDGTSW
jgi:Flp pilus assembly protein TadG